jgi:putative radical SAM enzyme (TIGR03279 family)
MERSYGQDLGLEFMEPTFDGIRRCRNNCDFCFVHQMPRGLRASLYVKDDDYRHSFLFGNFCTLTNLDGSDWERLAKQRLSPLYVSVHATDRELRSTLLGVPTSPDIVAQIRRLGRLGIKVHTQIVIVPGINDGAVLECTVGDLTRLHPTVASIAVVPVGITRYHPCSLRPPTPHEAKRILKLVKPVQRECRRRWGVELVYASDELYLSAGVPVPSARLYDGFPQLANGVGLVRQLLDDWRRARLRTRTAPWAWHQVALVCGELIAPTLRGLAAELSARMNAVVEVVAVNNAFFGPLVTVSGLLMAEDVISALRERRLDEVVVLPRAMFDAAGKVTLDGLGLLEMEKALGVPVVRANRLSELLDTAQAAPIDRA